MNAFVLIDIVGMMLAALMGSYIYAKDPYNKVNKIFFINTLIVIYTAFCEIFFITSSSLAWATFWQKISFLWPFFPAVFFKFVLAFTDDTLNRNRALNYYLFVPATAIAGLHIFTSVLYQGISHSWYGWKFTTARNVYSIFISLYFFICSFATWAVVIKNYLRQANRNKKNQLMLIFIGVAIPVLSGFLSESLLPQLGYDIPPLNSLLFIIGSIFVAVGILKYKIFIIEPVDAIKRIFATIPDYLVMFNGDEEILLASDSFLSVSGFKEEQLLGKKIDSLFSAGNQSAGKILLNKTNTEVEIIAHTRDKRIIPISATSSVIHNKFHEDNVYLLIGRDLRERKSFEDELINLQKSLEEKVAVRTEELKKANQVLQFENEKRKKYEEALRVSESKYKNLFENAPVGIYRTTPNGEILYANPAIIKMLGYSSFEELAARNLEIEGYSEHEYSRREFKKEIESKGQIIGLQSKWVKQNGKEIIVRENAKCIYDEEGNVLYYDGTVEDITEQILVLEALKISEERFRNLIENINEVYYITDSNGKTVYISSNVISFTGYPAAFFLGKSSFVLTYKEDFKRVYRFYQDRKKDSTIDASIEFRAVKKDGSIYWVEQITRFVRNKEGEVLEYRSVVRDISERKRAEETAHLLAQAVKGTSEGISITDLNNNIIFVNDAFVNIYGFDRRELIGKHIEIVRSENNPEHIIEDIRLATIKGGWTGELLNRKKNGKEFPIFLSTSRVMDDNGEPYALVGVTRDITERKEAERLLEDYRNHLERLVEERTQSLKHVNQLLQNEVEKLQIAEENNLNQLYFLQTLIDTIPSPIFYRDAQKIYRGCNRAFEKFHGITKEELLGQTVFSITPIFAANYVDEQDDKLLKDPGEQIYETISYDSEKKVHNVVISKATFLKADGSVGGIVGTIIDITEIKKLENDVRKALEKEKELSELKSRFISVASHEFRTPLTSILASADLLEMYGRQWPEKKYFEYVGIIQNSVEYMTELINDVLTVSKSDTGKIKFSPTEINLFELVSNIFESIKLSSSGKIKFEFNYEPEDRVFNLDNKLITQILSNLLSNAVKYSPAGGKVTLRVTKEDDCIVLFVSDEGIGIPEEDQKLLFEPFHRGNNVGAIAGTGLGLSIAKKSAEIHHGDLSIESKVNEGTKITVKLNCSNRAESTV